MVFGLTAFVGMARQEAARLAGRVDRLLTALEEGRSRSLSPLRRRVLWVPSSDEEVLLLDRRAARRRAREDLRVAQRAARAAVRAARVAAHAERKAARRLARAERHAAEARR
jgi:hypothetical protein